MDKRKGLIIETLDYMKALIEAHDGFIELGEISGSRVEIYCGGQCVDCDDKCIEEALKSRVPDIEVVFR